MADGNREKLTDVKKSEKGGLSGSPIKNLSTSFHSIAIFFINIWITRSFGLEVIGEYFYIFIAIAALCMVVGVRSEIFLFFRVKNQSEIPNYMCPHTFF